MAIESQNIYKNARKSAGFTQEKASQLLNVSVDSLRDYEQSQRPVPSDVASAMCDVYQAPYLAVQHLRLTSDLGKRVVPEIQLKDLPEAVLGVLAAVQRFCAKREAMVEIAADGQIAESEQAEWDEIMRLANDLNVAIFRCTSMWTRRTRMIVTAKIEKLENGKLVLKPDVDISRFVAQKRPRRVEVRLDDGRTISADQRRKIFAIIRDISLWSGQEPEELRLYLEWDFCSRCLREWFSLSNCDMTTAREFITYLIQFCFHWGVPTKDSLLTQTDDIGKYLYLCLENRRCAICNQPAEVHHVDRVGMGRDREAIVHVGLNAIALCRRHHEEAHRREKALFADYHIYGIKLDRHLCKVLSLNQKPKGEVERGE